MPHERRPSSPDLALAVRVKGEEVQFAVRLQPRAKADAIDGLLGDALKVRVSAPPVDGAANAALIALIAEKLGVARSAVRIAAGDRARHKVVAIRGASPDAIRRALTR